MFIKNKHVSRDLISYIYSWLLIVKVLIIVFNLHDLRDHVGISNKANNIFDRQKWFQILQGHSLIIIHKRLTIKSLSIQCQHNIYMRSYCIHSVIKGKVVEELVKYIYNLLTMISIIYSIYIHKHIDLHTNPLVIRLLFQCLALDA